MQIHVYSLALFVLLSLRMFASKTLLTHSTHIHNLSTLNTHTNNFTLVPEKDPVQFYLVFFWLFPFLNSSCIVLLMSIFCTYSVPSCVTPSQKKPLQRLQPVYIKSKKKDTRKIKKKYQKRRELILMNGMDDYDRPRSWNVQP